MLKKFLPFSLALALCGMLVVGCEEDPVSGDEPSMKAEVDGDDWETSDVAVQGSNTIVITGAKGDSSSITLSIPGSATVESHDIGGLSGYAAVYTSASQQMVATTGEITISSISSSEVAGTFEFSATDGTETIEVADGSFYAKRN